MHIHVDQRSSNHSIDELVEVERHLVRVLVNEVVEIGPHLGKSLELRLHFSACQVSSCWYQLSHLGWLFDLSKEFLAPFEDVIVHLNVCKLSGGLSWHFVAVNSLRSSTIRKVLVVYVWSGSLRRPFFQSWSLFDCRGFRNISLHLWRRRNDLAYRLVSDSWFQRFLCLGFRLNLLLLL